jgi:hypothetical protein
LRDPARFQVRGALHPMAFKAKFGVGPREHRNSICGDGIQVAV